MAQSLDLRCVLVPAPKVLGPKHVSNPRIKKITPHPTLYKEAAKIRCVRRLFRSSKLVVFVGHASQSGCRSRDHVAPLVYRWLMQIRRLVPAWWPIHAHHSMHAYREDAKGGGTELGAVQPKLPPRTHTPQSISRPTSFSSVQFSSVGYLAWTLLDIIFFLRSLYSKFSSVQTTPPCCVFLYLIYKCIYFHTCFDYADIQYAHGLHYRRSMAPCAPQ